MELSIRQVGTRLGGRWVVDGVDATPPAGALTGLLGPNGAGKTTLLRLVAGLLTPEAGAVLVGGDGPHATPGSSSGTGTATTTPVAVHTLPRRERARRIALLEQESSATVPLSVRDVVALGRIPYRTLWGADTDTDAVERALVAAEADHLADRTWSTLSGGERQRVHIARALAQQPTLLLLDEPTNHLDVAAQLHLLAFVRDLGTTTVAALHDLNLAAAFCEHVLVLSAGRLAAAGHPRDVLTPALLHQVYGVEADVLTHPRTGRPVIAFADQSPTPARPATDAATTPRSRR
ncbi:putative F420-0 ABC transporter ATP-binding protein [Cellulomonas soli]|uniref:putative F420-0 ABC transporter ATP-binding protein n=1 Tax=Cellulomonas soli TaxID=931535 RepID=UPI003F83BFF3